MSDRWQLSLLMVFTVLHFADRLQDSVYIIIFMKKELHTQFKNNKKPLGSFNKEPRQTRQKNSTIVNTPTTTRQSLIYISTRWTL